MRAAQHANGLWVVRETHGLRGGFFADHNEATRYAQFESAGRVGNIRFVPDGIEFSCATPV
jgi:hypothetical protein